MMAGMMDSTKEHLIRRSEKYIYNLIEGVFKPADAATLLFNLISDKVKVS